jgi:hypothetical protein
MAFFLAIIRFRPYQQTKACVHAATANQHSTEMPESKFRTIRQHKQTPLFGDICKKPSKGSQPVQVFRRRAKNATLSQ